MLERNNPKPLYQQLYEILMGEVESGKWEVDQKIPSENELSNMYGLSRMTVRSVITDMVKEGLLYRVQGKGTFVSKKIEATTLQYVGIREQLEQMGYEVSTKVIECEEVNCTAKVAQYLGIEVGAPVFKIKRVRYIKDGPISIHDSYINTKYSKFLNPELLEKEQLCVLLNKDFGLQRKKVSETLESVAAMEDEAQILGIAVGDPLVLLRDIIYDEYDMPYEYTKVVFRGDKIKIKLTIE